jgi:cell division protein ZapE
VSEGPLQRYRALRREGRLGPDGPQELAAEKLQRLFLALAGYEPAAGAPGWRARLGLARRREAAPQGLYIYGAVGRGKSMLMDLFFEEASVAAKRRVHFHAFMLDVHARLHGLRGQAERGEGGDLMAPLAAAIAAEAWLLCFDEFHVVDIADAMILARLFTALFEAGVVVVATSNWPPDQLYAGGLQRQLFLPFIALLKERLDVLELTGTVDHRRRRLAGRRVWHHPAGPAAARALDEIFATLADGAPAAPASLALLGRRLEVPRAARGVAWFPFEALCGRPLGPADYLALAVHYDTVIVEGIPRLTEDRRDETKRFMILVDALYEHKAGLVASAAAAPDGIFAGETHAAEFPRTASRLAEMQSDEYIAAPHLT